MENFKSCGFSAVDCFQVTEIPRVDLVRREAKFPSRPVVPKRSYSVKIAQHFHLNLDVRPADEKTRDSVRGVHHVGPEKILDVGLGLFASPYSSGQRGR